MMLLFYAVYGIISLRGDIMSEDKAKKERKAYDSLAKSLLAHKEIVANILKYAVKEFYDCSIAKIISCLNGNPEISNEPVDDDYPPKMDSAGSETMSPFDETRTAIMIFSFKNIIRRKVATYSNFSLFTIQKQLFFSFQFQNLKFFLIFQSKNLNFGRFHDKTDSVYDIS
ncbi:MAG: hypothetical protein K2G25_01745 [Oscillospiraceae bacterium]|nr:hypothetical protein [Oscillospiraceae bacterium]